MMREAARETRLERILGVELAEDAVRQWPQSGELLRGKARISEVESHFVRLRLGVGTRLICGNTVVVEWTADYGDGRLYRNVSIAELHNGKAIRVTDPAELGAARCAQTLRAPEDWPTIVTDPGFPSNAAALRRTHRSAAC